METDLRQYRHIIWDWNGTLLDDAWLCVEVMNSMLKERKLPRINLKIYREVFDFPVKDYYKRLGFDFKKDPFEIVGMEFMIRYNERQKETKLHPEVSSLLSRCAEMGHRQHILSAREQNELVQETIDLDVRKFFDHVCGLEDHYAHGKTDVGLQLLQDLDAPAETMVFIGDTLHDAQVAHEIGVQCILIPNGHHSRQKLRMAGVPIVDSLKSLMVIL